MQYTLIIVEEGPRAMGRARRHLVRCIYDTGCTVSDLGDVLVALDGRGIAAAVYQFAPPFPLGGDGAPGIDIDGLVVGHPEEVWCVSTDPDLQLRARTWAGWIDAEFTPVAAVPRAGGQVGVWTAVDDMPPQRRTDLH